jgi:hypothetical protein
VKSKEQLSLLTSLNTNKNIRIISNHEYSIIVNDTYKLDFSFNDILQKIVRDENLPLLYDRYFPKNRFGYKLKKSLLLYYADVTSEAAKVFIFLKKIQPDFLIFDSTPHDMAAWVKALISESLGIKVIIPHPTLMHGWMAASVGFRKDRKLIPINLDNLCQRKDYEDESVKFIDKLRSDYASAMPDYEKNRFKRNKGKYINLSYLIRIHWYRPSWIYNTLACWKSLNKCSKKLNFVSGKEYLIFFLHYQPERTTLPEGYGFTQQLNAIIALRSCLPSTVTLLVKEHPSTFTNVCNPVARNSLFYQLVDKLKGVSWIDITTDNFALIDSALGTATITGVVGIESLARGIPTIYFGVPRKAEIYGQHIYKTGKGLKNFIQELLAGNYLSENIKKDFEKKLKENAKYSFKINPDELGRPEKLIILKWIMKNSNLRLRLDNL